MSETREKRPGGAEAETLSDEERLLAALGPLLSWYARAKRDLPWRRDANPYHIWVSEIMLQQTRVEAVKPYYARFMEHFPEIGALAAAPEEELLKCWEGLGYYSRARNLKKAAEILQDEYGGRFPADYEEILALPGIGSYTAGAIASIAFGIAEPAVDGNVLRVLTRVLGSHEDVLKQATKRKMEALVRGTLLQREPRPVPGELNQALIETGALVCIPNGEPLCASCPFYPVCMARLRGETGKIPVKTPKKARRIEEKTVLLLEYEDKIAVRKRSGEGLLASLYEFVNVPGRLSAGEAAALCSGGAAGSSVEPLPAAKHVFSHVEWQMTGYFVHLESQPVYFPADLIFVPWAEGKGKYPIPSAFAAYKKILDERYGGEKP